MAIRYYVSTEEASFFNNNRMGYANSIPTEGNYKVGDFIISSTQENGVFGWVCTVAGNPGEWEVIGSGSNEGNNKIVGYVNTISFDDAKSSVEIGIDDYKRGTDFLEVHYNGLLLAEGVHYNVSEDGKSIVAIDDVWNENADDTQQMIFRVIKSEGNNVKELKNTIDINSACYEVEMGIDEYQEGKDVVEVHLNGVLLVQGLDYEILEGIISKLDRSEAWNPYNVEGQKMFVKVMKNNATLVEPNDGSVTMDKLADDVRADIAAIDGLITTVDMQNNTISNINDRVITIEEKIESGIAMDDLADDVKEAIEAAGNIDISGKQDTIDNNLVTTDKTIVGAINELFQSANNGKELIANAIGEPLSSEDTFSAMSNDINSLLSTFKTNMMNNGITVESSDKFKQLIDKIATMVEEGSGKGVKFASQNSLSLSFGGDFNNSNVNTTIDTNLDFVPNLIICIFSSVKDGYINQMYGYDNSASHTNLGITNNDTYYNSLSGTATMTITNITAESFVIATTGGMDTGSRTFVSGVLKEWYAIGVGEEDTTLRDSLASILTEEGVSITEEDDMSSLIGKVDNEFTEKNNEINSKVTPAGTAVAGNVLTGKTFINSTGQTITGSMANQGAKTFTPSASTQTGAAGYYSSVTCNAVTNLSAANIKKGVTVGGVTGTYSGTTVIAGTKYTLATYSDRIFLSYILYGDWNFYSYTMPYTGTVSVYMHAKQDTGPSSATYTVKRHNSANTVISTHPFSVNGENSTTINIAVNKGDIIRCYAYGDASYFYTDCQITFDLSE